MKARAAGVGTRPAAHNQEDDNPPNSPERQRRQAHDPAGLFWRWVNDAEAGSVFVYHTGRGLEDDQSRAAADAAAMAYDLGLVELVQRRVASTEILDYLAIKRAIHAPIDHPTKQLRPGRLGGAP